MQLNQLNSEKEKKYSIIKKKIKSDEVIDISKLKKNTKNLNMDSLHIKLRKSKLEQNRNQSQETIKPKNLMESKSATNFFPSPTKEREKYYMCNLLEYIQDGDCSNEQEQKLYRDQFLETFFALKYSKRINMVRINEQVKDMKIYFPKRRTQYNKTIIFDLDETLAHCTPNYTPNADHKINIQLKDQMNTECSLFIRPYATTCLSELTRLCEIIVFTASSDYYANKILEYIDPHRDFIDQVLYRENCIKTDEGILIKHLSILSYRDPKDILIVDNSPLSYCLNIDNAIPIIPFYGQNDDKELLDLLDYLKRAILYNDSRMINRRTFQLYKHQEFESLQDVATSYLSD